MSGRFVVVVGPDGVGKTTFATNLRDALGPQTLYFHFRPPVRGGLHDHVPDAVPQAKATKPSPPWAGWLRLGLNIGRFWLGYLISVAPALRSGSSVIGDRWAYGYLVQPVPLRFAGPDRLARLALAVMPKPEVVFNLVAPPDVVLARKQELTATQVQDELDGWAALPVAQLVSIDATQTPDQMVRQALSALDRVA